MPSKNKKPTGSKNKKCAFPRPKWFTDIENREALQKTLNALITEYYNISTDCFARLDSDGKRMRFEFLARLALLEDKVNFSPCGVKLVPNEFDLKSDPPPPHLLDILNQAQGEATRDTTDPKTSASLVEFVRLVVDKYKMLAPRILKSEFGISLNKAYIPSIKSFKLYFGGGGELYVNGHVFFSPKATLAISVIKKLMKAKSSGRGPLKATDLSDKPNEEGQVTSYVSRLRSDLKDKCREILKWLIGDYDIIEHVSGGYQLSVLCRVPGEIPDRHQDLFDIMREQPNGEESEFTIL